MRSGMHKPRYSLSSCDTNPLSLRLISKIRKCYMYMVNPKYLTKLRGQLFPKVCALVVNVYCEIVILTAFENQGQCTSSFQNSIRCQSRSDFPIFGVT